MFGLLNIDKPPHVTSRDAVNRVQRLLRGVKVGHAGTLDPLATGVLVVALGPATRLVEYVQRMPKTYVGTFLLGRSSDTEDSEGNVVELDHPPRPTRQEIDAALPAFIGTIQQLPPPFPLSRSKAARLRLGPPRRGGRTATATDRHLSPDGRAVRIPGSGTRRLLRLRNVYPIARPRCRPVARHRRRNVGPGADGDRRLSHRGGDRIGSIDIRVHRKPSALASPRCRSIAVGSTDRRGKRRVATACPSGIAGSSMRARLPRSLTKTGSLPSSFLADMTNWAPCGIFLADLQTSRPCGLSATGRPTRSAERIGGGFRRIGDRIGLGSAPARSRPAGRPPGAIP